MINNRMNFNERCSVCGGIIDYRINSYGQGERQWFGRDIETFCNNDKWWIYEPKDKEKGIDFLYFLNRNYDMKGCKAH